MNKHMMSRILMAFSAFGIIGFAEAGVARGQFTQNRETIRIERSSYSASMRKAYKLFSVKCGECHTLDKSLKPSFSSAQWTSVVKQMQAMASSQINDRQAQEILTFLNYDELHRKAQTKSAPGSPAPAADSVAAGRQFYAARSCDVCHSIAGKGGNVGPSLTDVGTRLSRAKLLEVIHGMKAGNPNSPMPALPPETTEQQINNLVNYLLTLKG